MDQIMQIAIFAATKIESGDLPTPDANADVIVSVINTTLNIIGALSLLMITVSGLRYILAQGDTGKISKAKNGIIYALVGIVLAISARTIVSFVVKRAGP